MTPLEFLRRLRRGRRRRVSAPAGLEGQRPTWAVIDEIHEFAEHANPPARMWWIPNDGGFGRHAIGFDGIGTEAVFVDVSTPAQAEVLEVRVDWIPTSLPEDVEPSAIVTPTDLATAPVTSPIPPEMARLLRDAACKICGVPHRRWYLVPETAPEDDQTDEGAADEPSGGRVAGGASALAGESGLVDPVEDFIDALSRQLDVETAALLAFQGPTMGELIAHYEAPWVAMIERRRAQYAPAFEQVAHHLAEMVEKPGPDTDGPSEPDEEASG